MEIPAPACNGAAGRARDEFDTDCDIHSERKLNMKTMRFGVFCALVGWIAADAQAQMGTYGSPDPIALGQYGSQSSCVPMLASRTSYVPTADGSGSYAAPATTANTSDSSAVARL